MLDLVDMLIEISEIFKTKFKISGQLAVISPLFVVLSEALRPKCGSHTSHIILSLLSYFTFSSPGIQSPYLGLFLSGLG